MGCHYAESRRDSYFYSSRTSVLSYKVKWIFSERDLLCFWEEDWILGYCLAHPWEDNDAPPLYSESLTGSHFTCIFIHDLAVTPRARNRGIGLMGFHYLKEYAIKNKFHFLSLVAIQGAENFWHKLGFQPANIDKSLVSYGETSVYMKLVLPA
ncbi:MAG: GNAT family N-acetyltransferase [Leptospiraceae bacterium]|nr:GNAT family N-acetyltransferase [Leptospiraceae bacterium]